MVKKIKTWREGICSIQYLAVHFQKDVHSDALAPKIQIFSTKSNTALHRTSLAQSTPAAARRQPGTYDLLSPDAWLDLYRSFYSWLADRPALI